MGTSYNPKIITDGLVLCLDAANPKSYPGSGTTWTDIINQAVCTLTNGPTFTSNYFSFDNVDDYGSIAYQTSLNTPNGYSCEIWVYPTGDDGEILSRGTSDSGASPDNPRIYVYANGTIYFDWSTTGTDRYITSTAACNINKWNQIFCLATPGSSLQIYINSVAGGGVQIGGSLPNPLNNTTHPIIIGGALWIPRYVGARISVIRMYNRVLSATEIAQNYNAMRGRFGV